MYFLWKNFYALGRIFKECKMLFEVFPWGVTWVNFSGVCATGISEPLPHYSLFVVYFVANYRPHLSGFWAFLVYFVAKYGPLRHFWANDFLNLKVPKKCNPILVTCN